MSGEGLHENTFYGGRGESPALPVERYTEDGIVHAEDYLGMVGKHKITRLETDLEDLATKYEALLDAATALVKVWNSTVRSDLASFVVKVAEQVGQLKYVLERHQEKRRT